MATNKSKIDHLKKNPTESIHIRFSKENAPLIVGMLSDVMIEETRSLNNAIETILLQRAKTHNKKK